MAGYTKNKHDIGFSTPAGVSTGLILARDKSGQPIYQSYDDEFLAEQKTESPSYSSLPPEKELAIVTDDWRSGVGLETYDANDPKRYYEAYNMDLRNRDKAFAAYTPTAVATVPAAAAVSITDGNFEVWTGTTVLDNWSKYQTGATVALAQEGTIKNQGDYSAKLTSGAGVTGYLYQDLTVTQYKGRRFTFQCYAYATTANEACIAINDGLTTTYSHYHTGSSAWQLLKVSKTLSASATVLQIRCYISAASTNVYFDGASSVTRPSIGGVTAESDFGDDHYKALGNLVTKLNKTSGTELTTVWECPAIVTDMEVYKDFLYLAQESTGETLEDCEDAWNEGTTHCASTLDETDYKVGSGSVKLVGSSVVAGDVLAREVVSLNMAAYDGVKLWIKSSAATAADDLRLRFSAAANGATESLYIVIPALSANVWTKLCIALSGTGDDHIISIGLEYNANAADTTIHLDGIEGEFKYRYLDTGGTATTCTIADAFAKFFVVNNVTLWKGVLPNELKSSTNAAVGGAWSSATTIDTLENDITDLLTHDNALYIMKEDRTFYLSGTVGTPVVNVLTNITRPLLSTTSGANSIEWGDKIYIPCGTESLLEYDAGTFTWRNPALSSIFDGRVQAVAGDDQWLFAIVDSATANYVEVLAGRLETIDGTTSWVWHGSLAHISMTNCNRAYVSSVFKKQLWIGSTVSTDSIYSIPIPDGYGDVVGDTNRSFATDSSQYFITPFQHFNFKGDTKAFIKATLTMSGTTTAIYFTMEYQLRGSTNWTTVGTFKTSPTTTNYIPVDDVSGAKPVSTMIRFKITATTNSATTTPVLYSYDIRAVLYPSNRRIVDCEVLCDNRIPLIDGTLESGQAATIKANIEAARAGTYPVDFYDVGWESSSDTVTVKFLPTQSWLVTKEKSPFKPERHYRLRLQQITTS